MRRIVSIILCLTALLLSLVACAGDSGAPATKSGESIHLSRLVGVWADHKDVALYRFSPVGIWYRYTESGEVDARGTLSLKDGHLELKPEDGDKLILLDVDGQENIKDSDRGILHRVEAPFALSKADDFKPYFTTWFEEGDLEGNVLTIEASSRWIYSDPENKTLAEGNFTVFAEEEETPYLFTDEEIFFATLSLTESGLSLRHFVRGQEVEISFCTEEDSAVTYAYFKDKKIGINYELGSGSRLLRNGGAAYNDQRDYKRMSVNCTVDAEGLEVENGTASFDLVVTYTFRKSDLPAMSGRIYNTVRFSQYDYYTGKIFTMDDSTGNELLECTWEAERGGALYRIGCAFSSYWEYPGTDEALVRWVGTYHLTMPEEYDGFVLCLRPVFNSYAAQLSSESLLQEDALALDDLGEDVTKCLFCRIRTRDIPAENGEEYELLTDKAGGQ